MENWSPEILQKHLDAKESLFLKLWKPGCGPCKLSKPAIERIEAQFKDKLNFAQIDTKQYEEMLEIANTDTLPVFFIFINKKMKGKHIGFKGLQKLQSWVEETLATENEV